MVFISASYDKEFYKIMLKENVQPISRKYFLW